MASFPQDRLIRKEVALGLVRERTWPENHIGLSLFAPFMDVESDDVIFQYVASPVDGLAPARAEDSEAELAGKVDTLGEGRAAIIDWAIKDHYQPSDISRYQDAVYIAGQMPDNLPLSTRRVREDFLTRVARDTALRRRKLDNRIEWLIMQALWNNTISYNDGKIIFSVNYGRTGLSEDQTTGYLPGQNASVTAWTETGADPINDALTVKDYMRDEYGIIIDRALTSGKVIRNILNSEKFTARSGLAGATGSAPVDPFYLIDGWGVDAAKAVFQRATGIQLIEYDSVYWTGVPGTRSQNRFSPEEKILFLPSAGSVAELDDMIGFGKTLTSPHPEGNWTSGFYEWEKDTGPDPWGHDFGTGIKAFPVFPHLDLTYVLQVLA